MSAFLCERDHFAYLVSAAMTWGVGNLRPGDYDEAQRIGNMLWQENINSLKARYGDRIQETPDFTRADAKKVWRDLDPIQVLKSIRCWQYQTCEHEGAEESEAWIFILALQDHAINHLRGYKDAEWGAPEYEAGVVSLMSMCSR